MSQEMACQLWYARCLPPPALEISGFPAKFVAGTEIYGQGEPTDFAYRVLTGAVRTFCILRDGRRQIEGFHFVSDVVGMVPGDRYQESAEAITDTQVLVMKRSIIDALIESDPAVTREFLRWTSRSLVRAKEQMVLLGRKTASEKVASFLLQLETDGGMADPIVVPMSRSDIADYLGLTVESVSRTINQFERDAIIEIVNCRRIHFLNRAKLALLAGK